MNAPANSPTHSLTSPDERPVAGSLADPTPANTRRRPPGAAAVPSNPVTTPTPEAVPVVPATPVEQASGPSQPISGEQARVEPVSAPVSPVAVAPVAAAVEPVSPPQPAETKPAKKQRKIKQTFDIEEDLVEMIKRAAHHKNVSMNAIVNTGVRRFIEHWSETKMPIPPKTIL